MAHFTYKGQAVDMGAMLIMNEHSVALGNANMNARGDVVGRGGKVERTAEEIADEHYRAQAAKSKTTNEPQATFEPQMEQFDSSLLSGYGEPEVAAVIDDTVVEDPKKKPAPRRRKKAPKAGE